MNLKSPEKYYTVGKPDRIEMEKNRKHTSAIKLFKKVLEDFSYSDFSLQDVIDSYNDQVRKKGHGTRYGKSHISYLVEKELLGYGEDNETYSVNHNSPYLAKMEMEDEMGKTADQKINWQEMGSKANEPG